MAPAVSASRTSQSGADAIREAPDAMWYVRPASGGQFGPASGEIMRSWLDDGRVGGTSLVWRAGWPEWRAAASVFPQLGAAPDAGTKRRPAAATARGRRRAWSDERTAVTR